MATDINQEFYLVRESRRSKECETKGVTVSLKIVPLISAKGTTQQEIVQWLLNFLGRTCLAIGENSVREWSEWIGYETIRIQHLEFYSIGLGVGGVSN